MHFELPSRRLDLTGRALTVGVISVSDATAVAGESARARHELVALAAALADDGADALDLGCDVPTSGGLHTGVGDSGWLAGLIEAVGARVDIPVGVETPEPSMVSVCRRAGAAWVADPSGTYGPDYLAACAEAGVAVRVTRCRADLRTNSVGQMSGPPGDGWIDACETWFGDIAAGATRAGVPPEAVMLDPSSGATLPGRVALRLVAATPRFSALGHVVAVSPDGHGETRRDLAAPSGSCPTSTPTVMASVAVGVALGCRVVRSAHVRSARRVSTVMDAIGEHR